MMKWCVEQELDVSGIPRIGKFDQYGKNDNNVSRVKILVKYWQSARRMRNFFIGLTFLLLIVCVGLVAHIGGLNAENQTLRTRVAPPGRLERNFSAADRFHDENRAQTVDHHSRWKD